MKSVKFIYFLILVAAAFSCADSKSDPPIAVPGVISGTITDASNSNVLPDVYVILFNAVNNAPMGSTRTDSAGNYHFLLDPGTYLLKLYKQGYSNIPASAAIPPIPQSVVSMQYTTYSVSMTPIGTPDIGIISGKVSSDTGGIQGVLVVADDGTDGYSTTSDSEGNYYIYNVPPASYTITGWIQGYNSTPQTGVTVTAGNVTSGTNIPMTAISGINVSGRISFLASKNAEVDVSLVNEFTLETIPGLSAMTSGYEYIITNVPNGTFLCRASWMNDNLVVDPDSIVKFGEPTITINNASAVDVNFDVTDVVILTSPTNTAESTVPITVTTLTPVFQWDAYPSTSDYVIEVMDSGGNVIWGGFSGSGTGTTKNAPGVIPGTSITYNGPALTNGKIYRWKIYSSKDDSAAPFWKIISTSEDQMGIIRISVP